MIYTQQVNGGCDFYLAPDDGVMNRVQQRHVRMLFQLNKDFRQMYTPRCSMFLYAYAMNICRKYIRIIERLNTYHTSRIKTGALFQ